ncbi:MAG: hypothetical protein ACJ8CR_21595 [Roseiflexaceae bacterium]
MNHARRPIAVRRFGHLRRHLRSPLLRSGFVLTILIAFLAATSLTRAAGMAFLVKDINTTSETAPSSGRAMAPTPAPF